MFYANAIFYEYFLLLFCQVLIDTQSQRVIEKVVETNKKMNIGDTEKSANIIKILINEVGVDGKGQQQEASRN